MLKSGTWLHAVLAARPQVSPHRKGKRSANKFIRFVPTVGAVDGLHPPMGGRHRERDHARAGSTAGQSCLQRSPVDPLAASPPRSPLKT